MTRKMIGAALAVLLLTACGEPAETNAGTSAGPSAASASAPTSAHGLTLTSPDVAADGSVPEWAIGSYPGYCTGENRSPNLQWSGAPAGTRSFAVLMGDAYPHWVVIDIPATATGLATAMNGRVSLGTVGTSLAGTGAYIGPCVAGNEYVYTLYALDVVLGADEKTSFDQAESKMDGHILARATLTTHR